MTETTLKTNIVKWLRANGFWAKRMPSNHMTGAGFTDILAIKHGLAFCLEVKLPGKNPTRMQEHVMSQLAAHGANVAVVRSVDEVSAYVAMWELTQSKE